jgi:hypothetical protein
MLNYKWIMQFWIRTDLSSGTIFAIAIEDAASELAASFFELKLVDNNFELEINYKQG